MTTESKTVTENGEGTKAKEEGIKTPESGTGTPAVESTVSSEKVKEEELKLYTQSEFDAAVQIKKSADGRTIAALEAEKADLEARIEEIEGDVVSVQDERDRLQTELEDMASNDPQRTNYVQKIKELNSLESKLKKTTTELEKREKSLEAEYAPEREARREATIEKIAAEYEGGNATMLKNLAKTLEVNTEEKLREMADGFGWKKAEPKAEELKDEKAVEKEKLILDGGVTDGGGDPDEQAKLKKRYPTMFK